MAASAKNVNARGMEDVDENVNNGIDEEESTGCVPSPRSSGTNLNKRLRSKVWDVFIPTFVDGKVALVASGSDPKQKKLSFLPSSQKKCLSRADASPEQKQLSLLDTYTDTKRKNQKVDQNGHKNQKGDHNCSSQEFVKILAMHGQSPSMMKEDRFNKLVAWLNPMVRMPSLYDLIGNTWCLFKQEKFKLKGKLTTLHSRVCLSAYMWHYDLVLAFLCLTVHYIDDEWEKQQKIIKFCPVDPTCNSNELSNIIIRAIAEWGLDGKVLCILLDDAFADDSVASNAKARLQEWNKLYVNRSFFVVRYATHLLDQVAQLGLDELDKFMEKSSKCSKYTMGPTSSLVHYPNPRYAPSRQYWITAEKICDMLGHFHRDVHSIHNYSSPIDLYEKLWDVKNEIRRKVDFCSKCASTEKDEGFLYVLQKMEQKFKERWELCFFHLCMPTVMDPKYHLRRIKSLMRLFDFKRYLNLFYEYSYQVDDPNCTSGSKTSEGTARDILEKYYRETEYPYANRPLTELDQYLQDPCLTTGESSVLQWWKENNQIHILGLLGWHMIFWLYHAVVIAR
ncbi:hypothetical protein U9M48_014287 [Paspalum notatum var. saurae]|uniref:hAT-like transposase RNase-H fold domain-containing protein n=1 Tax=Paspalum notatum var. saurae TaxID=547442 RepID=A0AAQ3T1C7_PASNO